MPSSIAHGNLSISIETQFNVSQAQPLAQGGRQCYTGAEGHAQEKKSNFRDLSTKGATVMKLIRALKCAGSYTA